MTNTQDAGLEKLMNFGRKYWGTVKQESMDVGFLIFSTVLMNPLDRLRTLKQTKLILETQEVDIHSSAFSNTKGRPIL